MQRQIAEYEEIKKLADAMANAIFPQKIILFGSFAKGISREDSDYDFCVVVDNGKDTMDSYLGACRAIRNLRTRSVDILIQEETKFKERQKWLNSVQQNIVNEGVVLYER